MTGLAAWVSNNSCCCEGQAGHAKSPRLCPLQLNAEWQCSSDDSMNSGILKILHALSAHSSRKKPAAISTSQCRSHNFAPKTGDKLYGHGLKPGASSSLWSLSSSGSLSASLSRDHTEQSTFWKHLRWNRRTPSLCCPLQSISSAAIFPQDLWLPQKFILQKAEEIR